MHLILKHLQLPLDRICQIKLHDECRCPVPSLKKGDIRIFKIAETISNASSYRNTTKHLHESILGNFTKIGLDGNFTKDVITQNL